VILLPSNRCKFVIRKEFVGKKSYKVLYYIETSYD